jgi:hypothetical protein
MRKILNFYINSGSYEEEQVGPTFTVDAKYLSPKIISIIREMKRRNGL